MTLCSADSCYPVRLLASKWNVCTRRHTQAHWHTQENTGTHNWQPQKTLSLSENYYVHFSSHVHVRWHSQVKLFRWTSLVDRSTAALPNKTSSNKLSLIYSFHHCHCTACVHSIPHCQMRKGKPSKSLEISWNHNPTSPDLPPLVMSSVDFQVATNVRARHVSLEKVSGGNLFLLRPSHSANHLASSPK